VHEIVNLLHLPWQPGNRSL